MQPSGLQNREFPVFLIYLDYGFEEEENTWLIALIAICGLGVGHGADHLSVY